GATAVGVVGAGGAAATGGAVAAGAITVATVVAALQIMGSHAEAEPEGAPVVVAASPQASPSPPPTAGVEPSVPPEGDATEPANLLPVAEDLSLSFAGADDAPLQPRQAQDLLLTLENTGGAEVTGTTVHLTLPEGMTMAAQDSPSGTGIGRSIVADNTAAGTKATDDQLSDGGRSGVEPAGGGASGNGGKAAGGRPAGGKDATTTDDAAADGGGGTSTGGTNTTTGGGAGSGTSAGATGGASHEPSGEPTAPVRTICTPGSEPGAVLCDVGLLSAGETREVQVTVRARAGGSYPIAAELRADDIGATAMELPARKVESFGPELTAQAEATGLMSPGRGVLPLRIGNTGDLDAASGWSVAVRLPEGVRPAAEQDVLTCTSVEARTWSCRIGEPSRIVPGNWRDLPLAVVALPGAAAGAAQAAGTASVVPAGVTHALDARAQVTVTSAWAGAAQGVGALAATCLASGGLAEAKAEISGTYTNTMPGTVLVALEAAGDTVSHPDPVAPGESVTLRRNEGIRSPAGPATWVFTRTVEGTAYEHRVPAGELRAVDCYDPSWEATASAETVNAGGRVGVRGTLKNTSDEAMSVKMVVGAKSGRLVSEVRTVPAGGRDSFVVATEHRRLDPGEVTFQLARWTFDKDGDPPPGPAKPQADPRVTYERAVIAPSYVGQHTMGAECAYDAGRDASIGTFRIPVDNTSSTLPVTFRLGDTTHTVAAGETGVVVARVPWGTGKLPLLSDKDALAEIDVSFLSCALLGWPDDSIKAHLEAQCVDGHERVVADVRNTGTATWRGTLVGKYSGWRGDEVEVPAGGNATLVLPLSDAPVPDSQVLVRLSRDFEGAVRTVERSYEVAPVGCEQAETCQDGSDAPNWFAALFGRRCPDDGGEKGDDQIEQVTFTPLGFWDRGYGA
ncbi:hypothetical protein IHE71_05210, partial [Myceligenerans sp. TRM 65318]|nr:hypothetical protein [Myceligenerans sp. TRM 65318]MBE3017381.1 hypothetical protein [Myceligenerans sp. TRM 65318]